MNASLHTVAVQSAAARGIDYAPNAWTSAWQPLLAGPSHNPMGVDLFAMVFGLGFVLSFGYWCTNFLVVQRAMAAKNMTAARNTPLVAAVPKMFFPMLVIVPGMIAIALTSMPGKSYRIPPPVVSAPGLRQCRGRRRGRRVPRMPPPPSRPCTMRWARRSTMERSPL